MEGNKKMNRTSVNIGKFELRVVVPKLWVMSIPLAIPNDGTGTATTIFMKIKKKKRGSGNEEGK